MLLSDVSIRRPVFATVMNILVVVAGVVAYIALPVREFPDIDYPVVSISTIYFGASPETIEATIVEPIEQVLNGIEGVRTITSTSAFSIGSINVEFKAGRDIDLAATDVSNAVQQALGELPPEAEKPIVTKAGSETQPIMWFSLTGEKYSDVDLTDAGDRIVKPALQLLPGVARVRIGGRRFAMRVWLDPAKMAARGVTAGDVRQAILQNNLQVPAGALEAESRRFVINLDAQIDDPREYERIVVRRDGDRVVRISDVGWVELGAEDYQTLVRAMGGKRNVGIGIVRQSRSNELEVSNAVHARMPEIERSLPEGMEIELSTDNTIFVRATLEEVWKTLAITFALVVLVNLFFLRSKATTIITSISIPISLIGTFAVMQVMGFSINVLSLLALVLVIGMVVDDSIVVLENVYRRQELGEPPMLAAWNGAKEVGFPVIATTLSVVAVLVPLSLMTGNTGRLFREFAITMAAAMLISMFVSLTVVPMACSRFLEVKHKHGVLWRAIEAVISGTQHAYDRLLGWFLRQRVVVAVFFALSLAGTAFLITRLPRTLVPVEDRGSFMTIIRAPQGSTTAYTERAMRKIEDMVQQIPEVESYFAAVSFGFGGPGDSSQGIVFTRLKHWSERKVKQQEIVQKLFPQFMAIPEALVFPVNPPSLGQGFRSADVQIAIKSSTADLDEFNDLGRRVVGRLHPDPGPGQRRHRHAPRQPAARHHRRSRAGVRPRHLGGRRRREHAAAGVAGPHRRLHPARQAVRRGDRAGVEVPHRPRAARRDPRARRRRQHGADVDGGAGGAEDRRRQPHPLRPAALGDGHREPGAGRDPRRGAAAGAGRRRRGAARRLHHRAGRRHARVRRVGGRDLHHLRHRAAGRLPGDGGAVRELPASASPSC